MPNGGHSGAPTTTRSTLSHGRGGSRTQTITQAPINADRTGTLSVDTSNDINATTRSPYITPVSNEFLKMDMFKAIDPSPSARSSRRKAKSRRSMTSSSGGGHDSDSSDSDGPSRRTPNPFGLNRTARKKKKKKKKKSKKDSSRAFFGSGGDGGGGSPDNSDDSSSSDEEEGPGRATTIDTQRFPPMRATRTKPDKKDYPLLKTDEECTKWKRVTYAVIVAHQLYRMLDREYVPQTRDEHVVFFEQNTWLYMVLVHVVKTIEGINIVNAYKDQYDARAVLMALEDHYVTSTAGVINCQDVMTWLVTYELDSGWNKSYSEFIIKWIGKAQQYNESCFPHERLEGKVLKKFLQKAVHKVPALRNIRTEEDQIIVRGGRPLTLSQHQALLKSAAQTLDAAGRRRRQVNILESTQEVDNDEPDGQQIAVYQSESKPRLPEDVFKKLSTDDKKAWFQMTTGARSAIATLASATKANVHRQVNKAETDEAIDISQETPEGSDNVIEVHQAESTEPSNDDIKADAVANAHPADVRRVLATSSKKKTATKKKMQANNVSWGFDSDSSLGLEYLNSDTDESQDKGENQNLYQAMATSVDDYIINYDQQADGEEDFWYGS